MLNGGSSVLWSRIGNRRDFDVVTSGGWGGGIGISQEEGQRERERRGRLVLGIGC